MRKKTAFFFAFSENLTNAMAPAFKWILKHFFVILGVLLVVLFAVKSIIYGWVPDTPGGTSIATALLEVLFAGIICLLGGFIIYLLFVTIVALVTTIGGNKAKTQDASAMLIKQVDQPAEVLPVTETENNPSAEDENEAIAPDIPRGIDEELLRKYLKSSFMGKPYTTDKTNFDGIVDNLKIVQITYRKAAKNGKGFTDKHIMQVATLLYQNKFMVRKGQFKDWCSSLFKAMNIQVPAEIRKSEPEDRIRSLFMFLSR